MFEQTAMGDGDELGVAIALLEDFLLEGKVIRADARLLHAPFVKMMVVKRGG